MHEASFTLRLPVLYAGVYFMNPFLEPVLSDSN